MNETDEIHSLLREVISLCRNGETEEAKQRCLLWPIANDNEKARIYKLRALISRYEIDITQEQIYLRESLRLNPKSRGVHHSMLRALVKNGQCLEALSEVDILLKLDREKLSKSYTESAFMYAAYCHFKLQNKIKAKECLEMCSETPDATPIVGTGLNIGELRELLREND